ncbi:SDR family NAD(P)-dependent oxidoreductase [bacterium]|nr:SDR family NAD(P)-dependent oxidoreductase [bacterium]NBX71877.1 SDR family NAD(P)-dependent oxidoreductase [bacterium]
MITMMDTEQSWALITGSSEGIGRCCALNLAKKGFNLILNARSSERLNELKVFIESHFKINIIIIAGDISFIETRNNLVAQASQRDLSTVILSAGFGLVGKFDQLPIDLQLNMIDVNCRAVVDLTYRLGEVLKQRQKSNLVLFSSIVGFQGAPHSSLYAATKNFIQSFGEGLQTEWKDKNINILIVAPGPIATKFAERAGMRMDGLVGTPEIVADSIMNHLGQSITLFPGFVSKFLGYSLLLLPRFVRTFIMGKVMRQAVI